MGHASTRGRVNRRRPPGNLLRLTPVPGTPFLEKGVNRVYRLPARPVLLLFWRLAAEQTGSRAAGTGGARVDMRWSTRRSARSLETRFEVNIPRLRPGLIIVAMGDRPPGSLYRRRPPERLVSRGEWGFCERDLSVARQDMGAGFRRFQVRVILKVRSPGPGTAVHPEPPA
mgnify:CR=1 FL=1